MRESPLVQRVFDELFNGLALCDMLDRAEMLEVAAGLRAVEADGDQKRLFAAVAYAVEAYANAEAQA